MNKKAKNFIFAAGFALLFCSCENFFQKKIDMVFSGNQVLLGDFISTKKTVDSLNPPVQVIASQGVDSEKILLTWSEVSNAKSYRIERAVVKNKNENGEFPFPEEGDYSVLVKSCYKNTYEDRIISSADYAKAEYEYRYFYRIIAENLEKGLSSEPTDPLLEGTKAVGWLFSCPKNTDASKGKSESSISISWTGVEEAVNYYIYRGESEDTVLSGNPRAIVNGDTFSYEDSINISDQGKEFFYKVVAENEFGNKSAFSSVAMGYSLKPGAPKAVDDVKVLNPHGESKDSLIIQWTSDTGRENQTVTYSLFRNSSVDNVYSVVKSGIKAVNGKIQIEDKLKLEKGVVYYYYVQVKITDNETQESAKSAYSEKTEDCSGFLLSPPESIEVEKNGDEIYLIWKPSLGFEKADYTYSVYAGDLKDGEFLLLEGSISGAVDESGLIRHKVEKKNFYRLTVVNTKNSLESDFSIVVAPIPAAPKNVEASKTVKIEGEVNANNVYPVKITWEKPDSDNPAGYVLYRSQKRDKGFVKLNEEPVIGYSYIDSNLTARAGAVYYYKVVSLNELNQGSNGNNPETDSENKCLGYGAVTAEQWFREYNKTIKSSQKKLTLMHKTPDTAKLGSEEKSGNISGTIGYNAAIAGLGAKIVMPYTNYADFYICDDMTLGIYFKLNGNTDTTSNMSGNGNMSGEVVCEGMYPGKAGYSNLEIKGGAAGGGYYVVTTYDLQGNVIHENQQVSWLVGEE